MAEGFLHDFAVTPDVTYIIAETQTEVRRVYTDGRSHLPEADAFPMWEGDSIGFWVEQIWREGDIIHVEMTFYDPIDLTRPWHVSRGFVRDKTPDIRIVDQWICAENNNVVQTAEGRSDFNLRGERGYKSPDAVGKVPAQ